MGLKGLRVKTIDLVGLHWHPRACSISCAVYSFNCSSNCNINIQMYSNSFPFSVHPTNKQISSCDNLQPDAARDKPSWRQTRLSDTWLLLNHRSRWSQNVVVYHHWPIDDGFWQLARSKCVIQMSDRLFVPLSSFWNLFQLPSKYRTGPDHESSFRWLVLIRVRSIDCCIFYI